MPCVYRTYRRVFLVGVTVSSIKSRQTSGYFLFWFYEQFYFALVRLLFYVRTIILLYMVHVRIYKTFLRHVIKIGKTRVIMPSG